MNRLKALTEGKNVRLWVLTAAFVCALALLAAPVTRYFYIKTGSELIYIEVDQKSPVVSAEGESLVLRTLGTTLTLSDGDEARSIKTGRIFIELTRGENGYWSVSGYMTDGSGEPAEDTALIEAWVDRVDTVTMTTQENDEARSEIRYAVRLIYGFSTVYMSPDTVEGAKELLSSGSPEPVCIALRIKGRQAVTEDVFVGDVSLSDYVRRSVFE